MIGEHFRRTQKERCGDYCPNKYGAFWCCMLAWGRVADKAIQCASDQYSDQYPMLATQALQMMLGFVMGLGFRVGFCCGFA